MRPLLARPRLLPLLLLWPLLACEPTPGGVHVVVEGSLVPGTDFDRLSVVASQPGAAGTPLALATLEGAELRLPATFNFESGPATPAGTRISVRATAERAGVVRSAASGEAILTEKGGARLTLALPPIPSPPDAGMTTEACDNGLDDDGDGLRDCADSECENKACQPGGLTCGGGVCGCAGRPAGLPVVRSGFARRASPVAVVPASGPLANTLVVAGGRDSQGQPSAALDLFFVQSSRLASLALAVERAEASLVVLNDGGVAVVGGVRAGDAPEPSLEWLATDGGTSRVYFTPSLTSRNALAGPLGAELLLAGGALAPSQLGGAERDNLAVRVAPITGAQSVLGPLSLACPAGGASLGDSFLLAGGCPGSGASARTDLISASGTVSAGPNLPVALEGPAVVSLSGARALVLGGSEQVGASLVPSARVFLVERPGAVVRVRELLPMDTARVAPRAVRVGNGWVYVEDAAGTPPVWFDPAAERFTPATALPTRRDHALAGGAGAQVYAAGGTGADGGLDDTAGVLELRCF
ncbi:hypothetical protein [Hyalangium rubrum]|uniref:Lipoprotein n=1 Tax=Hyalangium rubrum TaxID=3103134 RepID=A0ABU5HIU5_9BACT|nr:hypothetical protein [Hyalangium sp. s54d21]MDY7233161.1 hypothetical protein [Hyalangium sp. s54d21]